VLGVLAVEDPRRVWMLVPGAGRRGRSPRVTGSGTFARAAIAAPRSPKRERRGLSAAPAQSSARQILPALLGFT